MNTPRFPLRINVGFLLHQPIGTSRDIPFDFPSLRLPPDLELGDFKGGVHISRTPQGLMLMGTFRGAMQMECVRCLAQFEQPLSTQVSELYAFNHHSVTESGLIIPEDGNIDLAGLVRECLLLEIPIRPLCQPDCKGLCVICGADLNTEVCEHQKSIG